MDSLLARFAEDSYWMARYVERADSTARLLDVSKSFSDSSEKGNSWRPMLDLFSDAQRYRASQGAVNARGVMRFYVLEKSNPNSLRFAIAAAHHNARSLRHLISVEMWTHINVFNTQLQALRARDVSETRLAALCRYVKDQCQLFEGCTRNTLYRDQVWVFNRIGRLIERCDQTTRLIDLKSRSSSAGKTEVTEALNLSQWNALLRAASAYHGYVRVHPQELNAQTVASYVLFDPAYPGSIAYCLMHLRAEIDKLEKYVGTPLIKPVRRRLRTLEKIGKPGNTKISDDRRQQYLDQIQVELIGLHSAIAQSFFPLIEPAPS